jgi:FkbM family methyltransferase
MLSSKRINPNIKSQLKEVLLPGVRFWIRYSPLTFFKKKLWDSFRYQDHRFVANSRFGFKVKGQTHDLLQRYLYYFGLWEPNLTYWIRRNLSKGDYFVDVGANIGYYSLLAASIVGEQGNVIAIEASPITFEQLHENIHLNQFKNIRYICGAAAATRKKVCLYQAPIKNSGKSSIVAGTVVSDNRVEIEAEPLCELLKEHEIRQARLIKIDVEGAEWEVVQGLSPALKKLPENAELVIEISPERLALQNKTADDIFQILKHEGFYPYILENDYSGYSYLFFKEAIRPTRLRDTLTKDADVIFSHIDAEYL